ncbi:hypothetical protein J6590_055232 [Homalodisca vitripennis]|nr:hypothetical protein J6590_055232 [Homalodisca vitripennis]
MSKNFRPISKAGAMRVQWLSQDKQIKQRQVWLLLGRVTTKRSCPCKPARPLVVVWKSPLSHWSPDSTPGILEPCLSEEIDRKPATKKLKISTSETPICLGEVTVGTRCAPDEAIRLLLHLCICVSNINMTPGVKSKTAPDTRRCNERKAYKISLLSAGEFTLFFCITSMCLSIRNEMNYRLEILPAASANSAIPTLTVADRKPRNEEQETRGGAMTQAERVCVVTDV